MVEPVHNLRQIMVVEVEAARLPLAWMEQAQLVVMAVLELHRLFLARLSLMLAVAVALLTTVEQREQAALAVAVQAVQMPLEQRLLLTQAVVVAAVVERQVWDAQAAQAAPASSSSNTPYPFNLLFRPSLQAVLGLARAMSLLWSTSLLLVAEAALRVLVVAAVLVVLELAQACQ